MSKSNLLPKIILVIFALALIILISNLVIKYQSGARINVVIPWGLILIFMSLYLFRQYNRARKEKRENRREYMNERRQEILDDIFKKNKEAEPHDTE